MNTLQIFGLQADEESASSDFWFLKRILPIKPESALDIEPAASRVEYANGFPTLAAFIASDTDLVIFRRFDCLGARNLLYLQAELVTLEANLAALDQADLASERAKDMDVMLASKSWEALAWKAKEKADGREAKRIELIMKIRPLMAEYRMLMLYTPPPL
ncbi:hypothetical protein ACEPPN_013039 [Leptodophora sp. 'Broadleaf-Isolate-01']